MGRRLERQKVFSKGAVNHFYHPEKSEDTVSGPVLIMLERVPQRLCHAMPPSLTSLPPLPLQTRTAKVLMESPSTRVRARLQVCECQQGLGLRGQALGG